MPEDILTPPTSDIKSDGGVLGQSVIGALVGANAAHNQPLFDMSKARPIQQAKPLFDMSKAQPISPDDKLNEVPPGASPEDILMLPPERQKQLDARLAGTVGGTIAGTMAAGPVAAAVGGGVLGSAAAGGAVGAIQAVSQQVGEGQNPFRVKNLVDTAEQTTLGAAGGAALHGIAKGVGAIKNALTPTESEAELGEGFFQRIFGKRSETPKPQHGAPVTVESPFDRATVNALPGGKELSEEAFQTLQQHSGTTIPVGSSPKNTMMKAVKPVLKTIEDTGTEMNALIDKAPPLKSPVLADSKLGLMDDLNGLRENLPLKDEDPLQKVVDKQIEAAYDALNSTDPREVLSYRRKLGNTIDWSNITNNPETPGETANLTKVKLYNAMGNKLHTEIEGMADLDKVFQPNLELRSHLDAKLGKAVSRDPAEAASQQLGEHKKGLTQLETEAHNEKTARHRSLAYKTLGITATGAAIGLAREGAKHLVEP